MRRARFAWFALALFCAGPALASSAEPVGATIEQLVAAPEKYRDKTVTVRGQVDNCVSLTCNLCSETLTGKQSDHGTCLGLDFTDFDDPQASSAARTRDVTEEMFRFAVVTLTAKFDPTCLVNHGPPDRETHEPGKETIVVCTDRAPVLLDARVVQVHARHNADTGLVTMYYYGELREASDAEGREMQKAFADSSMERTLKFFIAPKLADPATGIEAAGYGCFCVDGSCEGRWPKRWTGGLANFGNPFLCYAVDKRHGVWHFPPTPF